jgi:hypothetical protein
MFIVLENDSLFIKLNNLPQILNKLYIKINQKKVFNHDYQTEITNLPVCLQKIVLIYEDCYNFNENNFNENNFNENNSNYHNLDNCGEFNILFCIRLPFDCELIAKINNIEYNVKKSFFYGELELISKKSDIKIKIKKSYMTGNPKITFFKIVYK